MLSGIPLSFIFNTNGDLIFSLTEAAEEGMPGEVEGPEEVFSDDDWYDVVDDQERDKRIADETFSTKDVSWGEVNIPFSWFSHDQPRACIFI